MRVISNCAKEDMGCARAAIRLARTTYAGFNNHYLCEKLCEVARLALGCGVLAYLLALALLPTLGAGRA